MAYVDFNALRSKVGVYDVAVSLGYQVNRQAGVGKFIEMRLPDSMGGSQDTLVISHPNDRRLQTYFHRTTGRGGGVVDFIKENLNSFNVTGTNEWDCVGQVMAKFANEPIPERKMPTYISGYSGEQVFDPKRYVANPLRGKSQNIMAEFANRGLSRSTVETFSPFLHEVRDTYNTKYPYANLGFPYREPGKDEVLGYEIRGYNGFKRKAAGTNSNSAAWIVDLSQNKDPDAKKNVYFAESGYDIMAFYQVNKTKLDKESSVFVSLGGTFSEKQVTGIMNHYSQARAMDCFDNDLAGRVYGIKMAALLENKPIFVLRNDNDVQITFGDKEAHFTEDKVSLTEFAKQFSIRYKVGEWKAPADFKDWNDVVMNKPEKSLSRGSVYERNERLEQARQMKM